MKITICGSLYFAPQMRQAEAALKATGHEVFLLIEMAGTDYSKKTSAEGIQNIIKSDLIREHYRKILAADAILVFNDGVKREIANYIGGNTFLEMGFAHVNNKKIFVLKDLPQEVIYYEEIAGMQPVIINGDLGRIA